MRARTLLAGGILALVASARPALPQSPTPPLTGQVPARQGIFVGGGLGVGSARVGCDGCSTDRAGGYAGYVRIGGTINPHFRLGFELNGWVEPGLDDKHVAFWSGAAYVYPSAANNLWLKGGLGLVTATAPESRGQIRTNGLGMSVGIGYDWAVRRGNFVVVPFANYVHQVGGAVRLNGGSTGVSPNASLFQLGIGFGYRH